MMNTYEKGSDTREIIINYTSEDKLYENVAIAPLSAAVISDSGLLAQTPPFVTAEEGNNEE
jgi:hypothetical protein